jgi:apolipoprotein N-acyltransferase
LESSYYKNILIPFGETLPFGPLNQSIVEMVPAIALFARGEGSQKMETRNGTRFVTPICYEILETEFMRKLLNEHGNNQFIVNHSNDSWYGTTAEPYQHLFLSKWRALEFAIPIIRSTNTGVTSVIYPDGSESKRLLIGEKKALEEVIPLPPAQNTIYQRYGVIPFLVMTLLMGLVIWWQEKN